ncbi:hypothetical protein BKI52_22540 [marine bacterium AO1-C]|nr:hypothetical protein BKI52_22540 [marine bacterium AO1-C]
MAYSDEDLDKYLKKAQEVLNSKTEDYLSEEDLQDIAQKLGLNMQEIAQAKEDYLIRGNNHLNFGNYKEAISEYEQLLLLAPKDPKGLYGLAKAHLETWHQDGKKAHKEKALEYANSCIEIDPKFQEAYSIISELKQKPQGKKKKPAKPSQKPKGQKVKKNAPKTSKSKPAKRRKAKWDTYAGLLVLAVVLAVQAVIFFYKSKGTSQYMVGATKQGIVVWQIKYTKYDKRPYYRKPKLLIAQASTGKLLKEIDLPPREKVDGNRLWHKTKIVNGSFYDYYKDGFMARDILTGKITDSKALLVQKFPKIGAGIGKVRHYNDGWFKITSKQGSEHWYNPSTKKLYTNDEYRQQNQIRTPFWQYKWIKIENPENRNQSKFLLTQQLSKRHTYRRRQNISSSRPHYLQQNINRGYTRLITKEEKANFFLKPKVIYSDSTHIIFKYQTEIGKQGAYRMACIGKSGDVLWEKGSEDLKNPLLQNLLGRYNTKVQFARYKNVLGVSSTRVKSPKKSYPLYKMAIGIDLNSGNVLWKHSPKYYDTKFK